MKPNFIEAIQQLERGKRMSHETVKQILEMALLSAARKALGVSPERVEVNYNESTGDVTVLVTKTVVKGSPTPDEIGLAAAQKIQPGVAEGGEVKIQVPIDDLGRIAAQTAKHIVLQRVREEERESLFEEFKVKQGKMVTAIVKQRRGKLVILDLGNVEAVLPGSEQIPKEDYRPGEHLKVYVSEVNMTPRGPHILASRNRPELVSFLFEQEVPEISQGIVDIKAIAREPGSRSKVAVFSHDRNIDPVGACIGMKGMRVQAVVQELHGEKMDVVIWSDDMDTFLTNSLSPAKPVRIIKNDETKTLIAVAADHNQLVHLIGRGGQNARLASKLTGWKVEVMTDAELKGPTAVAAPAADAPAVDAPAVAAPAVDAPAADAPVADAPAVDAPAVEIPAGESVSAEPATDTQTAAPAIPSSPAAVADQEVTEQGGGDIALAPEENAPELEGQVKEDK